MASNKVAELVLTFTADQPWLSIYLQNPAPEVKAHSYHIPLAMPEGIKVPTKGRFTLEWDDFESFTEED